MRLLKTGGVVAANGLRQKGIFKNRWYAFLGAIIILALFLSWLLYSGPDPWYDDSTYLFLAHQMLSGSSIFLNYRFGFGFLKLAPLAASFGLFGYGSLQAALPDMLEFVLLVVFAFLIGTKIKDARLGVSSAFLAATAPFAAAYASRVLPDMGTGLAVAVATYLFIVSVDTKHRVLVPLVFGFSAALPVYLNEEGFAIMGFIWIYLASLFIIRKLGRRSGIPAKRWLVRVEESIDSRYLALALSGTFIGLLLYFLPFYLSLNQPFFVFSRYGVNYSFTNPFSELLMLLSPTCLGGYCPNPELYALGPLALLAVFGSALLLPRRNSKNCFLIFLGWATFVFLVFGTTQISLPYHPIPVVSRFFAIILAPLSVLGAYAFVKIYDVLKKKQRGVFPQLSIFLIALLILAANLPAYAFLHSYDGSVFQSAQTAYSTAAFLANESQSMPIDVYVQAYEGFAQIAPYFLQFATGFDNKISFYSLSNATSPASSYPTYCSLNQTGGSYLVVIYGIDNTEARAEIAKETGAWLGNTCKATLLYEINQTYIYSLS